MARQKGIIKLDGTIGDITFYKSQDGYIAREKTSISGARIATDPAFQRTRENGAEFGRAGKACKLLRTAFRTQIQQLCDSRLTSRLTKEMMRVIQADSVNARGLRNVIDGEAELLEGFDFNVNAQLGSTFYAPYTVSVDRATGVVSFNLPSMVPAQSIAAPGGTSHYRLLLAASVVDFENNQFTTESASSALLAWDGSNSAALALTATLPANSVAPIFLALGIEFLQEVNGQSYSLKNGAFNAMALVKISGL